MHSVTDSFRIPRAKLAFLVDSMAAPLAIICPISSWVAFIIGLLRENGVHTVAIAGQTRIVASPILVYLNYKKFIFFAYVIFNFNKQTNFFLKTHQ